MAAGEPSDVNQRRDFKKAIWFARRAWVAVGTESFGAWRYYKDSYSGTYATDLGALRDPLIFFAIALVIASPALAFAGLTMVVRNRAKYLGIERLFSAVLLFLVVSVLVSMGSCMWTCGGHPTWSLGYK